MSDKITGEPQVGSPLDGSTLLVEARDVALKSKKCLEEGAKKKGIHPSESQLYNDTIVLIMRIDDFLRSNATGETEKTRN